MRRLDIGIASFNNPEKLDETIRRLREHCRTDYRIFVIDNASPDLAVRPVIERHAAEEPRIVPVFLPENIGYAGAVTKLLSIAETDYIGYCDNDAWVETTGWDEMFADLLDRCHEVGMVFPGGGPYQIRRRGGYTEIMWGVGFCWMINRMVMSDIAVRDRGFPMMKEEDYGKFDTSIGHQEEVDFQTRLRLAGWIPAALPEVQVVHHASSSTDPASQERINRGVIAWMNKWTWIFCGKNVNYHSANVMRIADWPPFALYLEEFFTSRLPVLNKEPEVVTIEGTEYDLIRVPRLRHYYRGRII